MATLYDELGVRPDVPLPELREAYRREARRRHPDLHPGREAAAEEDMRRLNAAWAILGDPDSRQAYDRSLQPGRPEPALGGGPDPAPRVHGMWVLLWPLLLVVFVVIFVFTAYASPTGRAPQRTPAAGCVSSVPGVEVYVPCDQPNVGHLVREVTADEPCPPGSFRHAFVSRPVVACVSRTG